MQLSWPWRIAVDLRVKLVISGHWICEKPTCKPEYHSRRCTDPGTESTSLYPKTTSHTSQVHSGSPQLWETTISSWCLERSFWDEVHADPWFLCVFLCHLSLLNRWTRVALLFMNILKKMKATCLQSCGSSRRWAVFTGFPHQEKGRITELTSDDYSKTGGLRAAWQPPGRRQA